MKIKDFLNVTFDSINLAKFWLGLQDDFDIEKEEKSKHKELDSIERYENTVAIRNLYHPK
ncbi:hypothetical protein BH10BAC4_BH10BAC4_20110 [soil metagenome]